MDALAPTGDEGRGQLRKASGSRKQALIRRYPNGETLPSEPRQPWTEFIGPEERTRGSEPSQYPEEKKETSMPKVVASEIGTAQIPIRFGGGGGCRAGNSRVTNLAAS